jgi:pyrimidine-nucleoside phosphorylase
MPAYEIIAKPRDGTELSEDEIRFMINGYTAGSIPDYQISAWLMAIFFRGMNQSETKALTDAVLHSGEVLDLKKIAGIKVDKHSTGGVGDKVSIILAPIAAAAGVPVPMISGRGLGHTGGTLDKLQSIPGFKIDYSVSEFINKIILHDTCLIGQTDIITPADKKLYALRDVTATIPSIPLITASIMSKKIAEGIDALVLDVKTGKGAFMQDYDTAVTLTKSLIATGERFGKRTVAFITNMDQPLGNTVGNWLEILECRDALLGKGPADLMELTYRLSGAMIYLAKKTSSIESGVKIAQEMITSGKAWQKFLEIVNSQQGDTRFLENPQLYKKAKFAIDVTAEEEGFISGLDALLIGSTAVTLGAGRLKTSDIIDPKAGIVLHKKQGDPVSAGEKIMTFYTDKEAVLSEAEKRLRSAAAYSSDKPPQYKLIFDYLDKSNL